MLIGWNLHEKSNKVSIKTRSSLASLSFIGHVTQHITVKGSFHSIPTVVEGKFRGTDVVIV